MTVRRFLFALALAALGACSDEGPVSGPGTVTATLVGPNGPEGAAVVTLLGDGIGAVTSIGGTEAYAHTGSSTVRVVLINGAGGELAFRVAVPDTTQPPSTIVTEVAGPDDELRADPGLYRVEFGR